MSGESSLLLSQFHLSINESTSCDKLLDALYEREEGLMIDELMTSLTEDQTATL